MKNTGELSTANLFSELVTTRLQSNGNIKDHLHQFRRVHKDLVSNIASSPNLNISKPFVANILINSLPSEYTTLVQSLLTSFDGLTLSRLYSLLQMEATRTSTSTYSDSAVAAFKQKNSGKRKDWSVVLNGLVCSLGHPGHSDENCRVRKWRAFKEYEKYEKAKLTSKPTESAQVTSVSVKHPQDNDCHPSYWESAFSASVHDHQPESTSPTHSPLLGDTGASGHMFKDRHLLQNLHSTKPIFIGVASNEGTILALEAGSVKFGSLGLSNVLSSKKLTSNLVSIG